VNPEVLAQIPETLTYEDSGRQLPLRDHPFVKDAPDLPTFVKTAFDAHREVGARIPVRLRATNDAEKVTELAEWKKNHLPKLYEGGFLARPPASPDDYNDVVKRPEKLPDGFGWNEEYVKDFKTIMHKHGVPKDAIPELLALHERTLTGAQTSLKTSNEAGLAALKAEYGDKYDELREATKRLTNMIFKTPDELAFFESLGLGDHADFLSVMMRLAPLAQADSSFFASQGPQGGPGALTGDDVRQELAKIATDKTHPMHDGYLRNDPKVMDHIEGLYKRAYGDKKVEIV